jgi:hypothetical protein
MDQIANSIKGKKGKLRKGRKGKERKGKKESQKGKGWEM